MKSLLVIAGEDSGDMHAADVIRALKERCPDVTVWGIGGDKLRAEGMELLHHTREMDVLGIVEVLKRYPFFKRTFNEVLAEADRRKPDAALLVDYPGFNLRLARELKKRGIKVLYYVCPQVWAWNRGRIPKMAEIIDRLMVIFPFEVDVFKGVDL
jgi:lipid-A-disaccharide synthase